MTPVAAEPMLGYHPCSIGFLTSCRDPAVGQCLAGSLTPGCAGKGVRSAEDHPRRETGQVVQPVDAVNMQALQRQIPQGLGSLTGLLAVLKEQDHVFLRLMRFQPERHPRQNSAVSVVAAAVIRLGDNVRWGV